MKLHVLGSAGYHPNDYRQTICLMIPEIGVIFDAGTGFYPSDRIRADWKAENIARAKEEALKDSFLNWRNIPPDKRDPPHGLIG